MLTTIYSVIKDFYDFCWKHSIGTVLLLYVYSRHSNMVPFAATSVVGDMGLLCSSVSLYQQAKAASTE